MVAAMTVIGERLRAVRIAKNLSLSEFSQEIREDQTFLNHIENGRRFPPSCKGKEKRLEKFARLLGFTVDQLRALIGVERTKLNPYELLPELAIAPVPENTIEAKAEEVLNAYTQKTKAKKRTFPIPLSSLLFEIYRIEVVKLDFK